MFSLKRFCKLLLAGTAVGFMLASCYGGSGDVPAAASLQQMLDDVQEGGSFDLSAASFSISENETITIRRGITLTGGFTQYNLKNAVLNIKASNVVLSNVNNVAEVIVAEEVGDGDFTMNDCDVAKINVRGGGSNSIHLNGVVAGSVDVEKEAVRILLGKGSNGVKHSDIVTVNVKIECKLDSEDSGSSINRVIVSKDVTKVTLSGQTAVSTLVVNSEPNVEASPLISIASDNVKIQKAGVKKGTEVIKVKLTLEVGVSSAPSVDVLTEEETEALNEDLNVLSVKSKVGDLVYISGKECRVTVNKFLGSDARSGLLNTEKDVDFRAKMLDEYSSIKDYIEVYQLPSAKDRTFGGGGNSKLTDRFLVFDSNVKKIVKIDYTWSSDNLFVGNTVAERAAKFDVLTDAQIRSVNPDSVNYETFPNSLYDKIKFSTRYKSIPSSTSSITDAVVDLGTVLRFQKDLDFLHIDSDGKDKNPYTEKLWFDDDGILQRREYMLRGEMGQFSSLICYELDKNNFQLGFYGNGFDSVNKDEFNANLSIRVLDNKVPEFFDIPVSCHLVIRKNGERIFENDYSGKESLCLKKTGDGFTVICPYPDGTPVGKYAVMTFKKASDGSYQPDIEAYKNDWEKDFISVYESKFWNNKAALISAGKPDSFMDKLIAEKEASR